AALGMSPETSVESAQAEPTGPRLEDQIPEDLLAKADLLPDSLDALDSADSFDEWQREQARRVATGDLDEPTTDDDSPEPFDASSSVAMPAWLTDDDTIPPAPPAPRQDDSSLQMPAWLSDD